MRCHWALLLAVSLPLLWSPPARAYERYKNPSSGTGNCSTCHGNFPDDTSPMGTTFPSGDKHEMHRGNASMNTDCDLCHTSGDGRNPFIGSSDGTMDTPGLGCVGCHGRAEDAGQDLISNGLGAGLRQHHHRAGVVTCANCHTDADPMDAVVVGEQVPPPYYGSVDTLVAMPCNPSAVANANENWSVGDFIGLDNDGDGLFDLDDPDCQAGTTTTSTVASTTSSSIVTTSSTASSTTSSSTSSTSTTLSSTTSTTSSSSTSTIVVSTTSTTTSSVTSTSTVPSSTTSSTSSSSTVTTAPSTSTSSTSTTPSTSSTSSSTSSVTTTSSTSTTLPGTIVFPSGTKLLVKQKKSGAQRLKLLAKDPAVQASPPCDAAGALTIQAGAALPRTLDLDATLWRPLKAKAPEKGCKYRKGLVVLTVVVKEGKLLKLTARADDLGVPLAADPRPVRIELRHGDVRHCLEFGGDGKHVADKKLIAKGADPATACPTVD